MRDVGFWVLFLALVSGLGVGDRVGVVVQYDDSTVVVDCVDFSGAPSAYDILMASRFAAETVDFPPFGPALCGIDGVGCPASNCFCDAKFWGFYYVNGGWQMSGVGISSADDGGYQIVQDGGVIGFRWGSWGQQPAARGFAQICVAGAGSGGYEKTPPPQKLNLTVSGGCYGGEDAGVMVADEYGSPVFLVEVNVLRRVPGTRFAKEGVVVTDGDGKGVFQIPQPGAYYFEAMAQQYVPDYVDVFFHDCLVIEDACEGGPEEPSLELPYLDGEVVDAIDIGEFAGEARAPPTWDGGMWLSLPKLPGVGVLSSWVETGWEMGGWLSGWRPR